MCLLPIALSDKSAWLLPSYVTEVIPFPPLPYYKNNEYLL